jgi:hypothetical protein
MSRGINATKSNELNAARPDPFSRDQCDLFGDCGLAHERVTIPTTDTDGPHDTDIPAMLLLKE